MYCCKTANFTVLEICSEVFTLYVIEQWGGIKPKQALLRIIRHCKYSIVSCDP